MAAGRGGEWGLDDAAKGRGPGERVPRYDQPECPPDPAKAKVVPAEAKVGGGLADAEVGRIYRLS